MTEKIVERFIQILPSVPATSASAFADGMQNYYTAFKTHRESAMNYESKAEYLDAWHEIIVVKKDDLSIHSPQFRKVLGLSIGELFKTKITMFSPPSTVDFIYSIVYVDENCNRWIVSLLESDADANELRICARLPRSGTKVSTFGLDKSEIDLSSPNFNNSGIHLMVQDTIALWGPPSKIIIDI